MLLSFSRGAWFNLGVATAIYGALHILTVRDNRARLRFAVLAVMGIVGPGRAGPGRPAVRRGLGPRLRAGVAGPELRRGSRRPVRRPAEGGRPRSWRIRSASARSSSCRSTTTRSRTTSISTMFLNAGWVGGLIFLGLVGSTSVWGLRHAFVRCATQPLFLVVYACFVANAAGGRHHRPRPLAPLLSADGAGVGPDAGWGEGPAQPLIPLPPHGRRLDRPGLARARRGRARASTSSGLPEAKGSARTPWKQARRRRCSEPSVCHSSR